MRSYFLHLAGLLALVGSVIASPVPVKRSESPLVVELAAGEGSVVQITVTNTGAKDLNILTLGSFLSNSPVEKVDIYHEGIYIRLICIKTLARTRENNYILITSSS